ncbi:MAG: hypothetical protein J7M27_02870 [Candidatus Latescibacteria bacterium]|nr:hypothetical protein [Candidatus Latescibacterota bacterium]
MNPEKVLYLSRKDVECVGLPMPEIIEALDRMFREKGAGRVEMPPKPGIHTRKDAFIHAMPAYIPSLESAGMKWVSGYPGKPEEKAPVHKRSAHPERPGDRHSHRRDGCDMDHGAAHGRGNRSGRPVPGAQGQLIRGDSGLRRSGQKQSFSIGMHFLDHPGQGLRCLSGGEPKIRERDGRDHTNGYRSREKSQASRSGIGSGGHQRAHTETSRPGDRSGLAVRGCVCQSGGFRFLLAG